MLRNMGWALPENAHLYTTTRLTEDLVEKYRRQRNLGLGWAAESNVPTAHYTPEFLALAWSSVLGYGTIKPIIPEHDRHCTQSLIPKTALH